MSEPDAVHAMRLLIAATDEVLDTELGEMACLGSHVPAEDALGKLVAARNLAKTAGLERLKANQNPVHSVGIKPDSGIELLAAARLAFDDFSVYGKMTVRAFNALAAALSNTEER